MSRSSRLSAVAALALAAACAGRTGSAPPAAAAPPAPAAAQAPAGSTERGASGAVLADGRAIFMQVCATCHSVQPPPLKAPPMSHVARHYRDRFASESVAVAAIAAWVRAPGAERSALPAHARERWGLMPPLALPDSQLSAVARYVWTLADSAHGMGMRGGMGRTGAGHQHGPPPIR